MTRERQVYPTTEVPHKWAHQTQASARNQQNNLFFEGATIYSYRHSWPLATIHTNKRGVLVLSNPSRCSVTTAGHQYSVNGACSHLTRVEVPHLEPRCMSDHTANLKYLQDVAAGELGKAQRTLTEGRLHWYQEAAEATQAGIETYCRHFGIRRKIQAYMLADWQAARERLTRLTNPDPVRDAKRFKEKERREVRKAARMVELRAKYQAAQAENISKWRAGEDSYMRFWPNMVDVLGPVTTAERRELRSTGLPCMLRVKDGQIETSQGAKIPVEHAPRLWRAIRAVMQSGTRYVHNGHTIHAGDYRVDSIEVDGTLRAGCHVIPYAELQALAVTLGLAE